MERRRYGFDSRELWNLDISMVEWLLPRLKMFKEYSCGTPGELTEEQWNRYLDRMIRACELYIEHGCHTSPTIMGWKPWCEMGHGHNLFIKYFQALWS